MPLAKLCRPAAALVLTALFWCNLPVPGPGSVTPTQGVPAPRIAGQVVDSAGKAVSGVKVSAFMSSETPAGLIGNVGAGLIGNVGAGLAGNACGGLAAPSGYRIASVAGTTDASGSFYFWTTQEGDVNLEAVQTEQRKAWKFKLKIVSTAQATISLSLTPTATLSGLVLPASGATGDTVVYIPGSTYWTFADANGGYAFGNLPPGKFEVKAARRGYREAALPSTAFPDPLKLTSGATTAAPTISLEANPASPAP